MERCPECGFVYLDLPREHIATAVPMVAAQFRSRLGGPGWKSDQAPGRWSVQEYALHVRELVDACHHQIALTLRFDRPTLALLNPTKHRPDQLPVDADRHRDDDPRWVAHAIEQAADRLASLFATLSDAEWQRVAVITEPHPRERDVTWMGRNVVHELAHHLLDITRCVDPATTPASG